MDRAERVAREHKADLVLATDPDADRIGGHGARDGRRRRLPLPHRQRDRRAADALQAEPSSRRQGRLPRVADRRHDRGDDVAWSRRIARHFSAQVVDNLLVGFKYIADVLWQLEATGSYERRARHAGRLRHRRPRRATASCRRPSIRDKDAGGGGAAAGRAGPRPEAPGPDGRRLPRRARPAVRLLPQRGAEHRHDRASRASRTWRAMLDSAAARRRRRTIGGLAVTGVRGPARRERPDGPAQGGDGRGRAELPDLPPRRAARRSSCGPSGTEPKAKAYLEVRSAPWKAGRTGEAWDAACRRVDALAQRIATDFLGQALATVGLKPAAGADKLSR